MKHYSTNNFHWKKDELYEGTKKTGISVTPWLIEGSLDNNQYKIKFAEGDYSEDFYNISRAKDNALKYAMRDYNKTIGGNALHPTPTEDFRERELHG
jgi:hypothetical protein